MKKDRIHRVINSAQIVFWALLALVPGIVHFILNFDIAEAGRIMLGSFRVMLPAMTVYFLNALWLVPKGLIGGKKGLFFISNALILVLMLGLTIANLLARGVPQNPYMSQTMMIVGACVTRFLIYIVVIVIAVAVRYVAQYYELKHQLAEQKQKEAEAELTWLRSQLNPHFLFNTLNNISSLTQTDPDLAQDSIGQLSDILRYALYDTREEKVPLAGEISFMQDYIDLMKLRCNSATRVEVAFDAPAADIRITPLLFISLIENAFKHGVNARAQSLVRVSLVKEGRDLVFRCDNTVFAHGGEDHIGSGIGLENMSRRLELLYPGKYSYTAGVGEDGLYHAALTLKEIYG